ncbi:hypothetical protein PPUJ20028_36850 [Pseudomonas putida]|uniref:DUF4434 domain-containing protein n=1 Tax=Pseudomonas putida TaxID=303 RepID=A0AA37RC42_PSEPU|nr:DUF4434 family protein [Pseudomonas putida]GLO15101.1 hypothetical protein PPUJ20028_36850 [Pseudomonas putida]GLO37388.1 hypothetical protein PPUN14671_42240 [Pseudomonas putida]HDS0964520.1 DUF4434 family protein [Pseudomonas putida]HDS0967486.1 DUF4434 family protein [Pseudomonas putida]HDS0990590.1 DUF4434 family protein [Pseudomonas putida]
MRTILALCLLALCLPATADQRLFYQPLNRDADITPAQWQQLWHATVAQGGKTLIVQWSAYGDSDFGGAQGWLANSLRSAHAQGLQLVLGLYMDPAYYQRLDELDGEGLSSYWKAQLGRSLSQYQQLRHAWQLPVDGWYLPMELDDQHFREAGRRDALFSQLQAFNRQLDKPLHISAFSVGKLSPSINAAWLEQLAGLGLTVWWQDGIGTGRLPAMVRQGYEQALPCRVGVVREAFRQVSGPGQAFRAEPAEPKLGSGCHAEAVFALRYRPWARNVLPQN